jgi:hypothetical protein
MLKTLRSSRIPLLLVLIFTLFVCLEAVRTVEAGTVVCSTTWNRTPTTSGRGATCDDAQADLYYHIEGYYTCGTYGVCAESATITKWCFNNGREIEVNGYGEYRCYVCLNGPCPV